MGSHFVFMIFFQFLNSNLNFCYVNILGWLHCDYDSVCLAACFFKFRFFTTVLYFSDLFYVWLSMHSSHNSVNFFFKIRVFKVFMEENFPVKIRPAFFMGQQFLPVLIELFWTLECVFRKPLRKNSEEWIIGEH